MDTSLTLSSSSMRTFIEAQAAWLHIVTTGHSQPTNNLKFNLMA